MKPSNNLSKYIKESTNDEDVFPAFIPLSADTQDILQYINQPIEAWMPVGSQQIYQKLENATPQQLDECSFNILEATSVNDLFKH